MLKPFIIPCSRCKFQFFSVTITGAQIVLSCQDCESMIHIPVTWKMREDLLLKLGELNNKKKEVVL